VRYAPAPLAEPARPSEPQDTCPICRGAGWLTKAVRYGDPDFGKLFACRCKQAEQAHKHAERLAAASSLDAFRTKTFDGFVRKVPGVQLAYQRAQAFARQPEGWLGLFGPYGCGKTHLAAAIANELLSQQVPVQFVVVPDLLDHLRSAFAPDSTVSYDQRFDAVKQVPVLVLDDLGTESGTPWAREKLYQLVNHRYNERLPTVFTSNIRVEQLDPRIASRMHDPALHAQLVTIQAADYRRRKQNDRSESGNGGGV
jgi:DNA replication protein DnaC